MGDTDNTIGQEVHPHVWLDLYDDIEVDNDSSWSINELKRLEAAVQRVIWNRAPEYADPIAEAGIEDQ